MDYVGLLTMRDHLSAEERDAALLRRAAWQYPAGLTVIAEYWPMGSPAVVTIFSADDAAAIMELFFEWEDVFDIDIRPAVSAEDGLRLGPDVFGRLARLRS